MTSHLHPVQVHHPPPTRYVRPATLDDALRILADARPGTARIVAGATDLSLEIERGARRGIELLVDLSATDLGPVLALRDGIVTVSAQATHRDVIRWPEAAQVALPLAQACAEIGSPQLRNRATVVGNVVTASPANDTISALSALDAEVHLRSSDSDRTLPLGRFITGFRTTALEHGEVVVAISFPALGEGRRGVYAKLGNRSAQAISVVHLAAVAETDPDTRTTRRLTLAVGSIGPVVRRFDHLTERVTGRPLDTTAIDALARSVAAGVAPIDDVRATADYRRATVEVLVVRSLRALTDGAEAARWDPAAPTLATGPSASRPAPTDSAVGPITVEVNGAPVTAGASAGGSLLDWLRGRAGLLGTKEGCAEGECGACTVVMDGAAVVSCLVRAHQADGRQVTTIEGLGGPTPPSDLQEAFVAAGAAQCGFCTPGFVVAAERLLAEVPDPTTSQIRAGLAGNLCRCTGYTAIVAAVERAAAR